jgi:hypothetical protein
MISEVRPVSLISPVSPVSRANSDVWCLGISIRRRVVSGVVW